MQTMTDEQGTQAAEPRTPRRLYRRMDDRMIAGVAGGVAEYFNVDPTVVRIAFVVVALIGGAGIVAYLLAWWLVPPAVDTSSAAGHARGRSGRAPGWAALTLILFGFALLLTATNFVQWDAAWGLAIIGLGVLLFLRARDRALEEEFPPAFVGGPTAPTAPLIPPPSPFPPPSPEAPTAPLPPAGPGGTFERPAPALRRPPRPQPRRRRERSTLGWATLGLALLATGLVAFLDALDVIGLSLAQYVALPLAVIGAGLFVGAWRGRARWLLIPGLFLLPLLLLAGLVDVPLEGGFADRRLAPGTAAEAAGPHRLVAGALRLDLTTFPIDGGTVLVTASVAAGELQVYVPAGVRVVAHGRTGVGAMWLLGSYSEGFQTEERVSRGPQDRGTIELDLAVSFGRIVVERVVEPVDR